MNGSNKITTLLRNAGLVLPERSADDASLLIQHGRIDRIFGSLTDDVAAADVTIDCRGLTVYPGFIDVHIHGAVDTLRNA